MAISDGAKLGVFALIFQILLLILLCFFGEYGAGVAAVDGDKLKAANKTVDQPLDGTKYAMFQDVHVMIFVGFGFLMTFLSKYGFSAVGYNFLISALAIQWSILIAGFLHLHHGKISIGIGELLGADFATAAVLISFGAVLGKTSALQLFVMTIIEIVIFNVNEYIGRNHFQAVDAGDSIFVHAFGAYFGLAVARVLYQPVQVGHAKEGSVYHSDLFAMIGSLFLWLFWPSFNSGGLDGIDRHRAIVNTYLALASCCVTAFAVSALVDKKGKLNMVHIQNSTLAGGVAVGAIGNFVIQPWGAILVGIVAAVVSVCGYQYLTPLMASRLKIHDTCGVHNLHGMPAIIAAIGSAVASAVATKGIYKDSWETVFEIDPEGKASITGGKQAGNQMLALLLTLAFAVVGGVLTGFILKIPIFGRQKDLFEDAEAWILEEEEEEEAEKQQQLASLQAP